MNLKIEISEALMGRRLDLVVADVVHDTTRGAVVRAIEKGLILVSGNRKKPAYRVKPGEVVCGSLGSESEIESKPRAESISLDFLHEDQWIVVVNKPAGMVVHPGAGNSSGTLLNALLHHFPSLTDTHCDPPLRGGIVHRLDKDTSGTIVVAKSKKAYEFLQKEFRFRRVEKRYIALATGIITETQGRITLPIGRHPIHRKRMAVNTERARPAETLWRVLGQMAGHTLLDVGLKTGRTHQIRVHFRALGHPLAGDRVYGFRGKQSARAPRQMLHAGTLGFRHPWSGKRVEFTAPLPEDMVEVLERLNRGPLSFL
ncbi:RluD1 [Desulforapulum autotrophicum HRM2]|uniref:Pseudouridine synthase n=1 Tax=Desulforapulum autotrophicum (strain ATCC 43914 / DSM 3382 / VKM B-1955 / HRM2) TaxID=177437 RepID=C0QAZ3_DESAH|nr:RluA family pseudouridine synthase [Desulforapulum autotrophicum]ACN14792.1 RluD1 [Desulforapulum autotrophicum HRM2]